MDNAKDPREVLSSPHPDYVAGLPVLDRDSLAILTRDGNVTVARDKRLTTYRLGDSTCEPHAEVEFKYPITAIAESESGVIVASGNALHHATPQSQYELTQVDGGGDAVA